jgi:enterochelin esterase-like enzyme
MNSRLSILVAIVAHLFMTLDSLAQRPPQPPPVTSPEVGGDRRVVFRVRAPKATSAKLTGGDLPGMGQGKDMAAGTNGVWEVTIGPLPPGAYRYQYEIDGVAVIDPRNPKTSESNENPWSLVHVPGADWMDAREVPHGAVSEVTYWSSSLKRFRRLHVYTPPGYEAGSEPLPVLYLLHGAFDSDDSWSTVGRAGFILDNLIAAKTAHPMIVVMPHGHTGPFRFGMPFANEFEAEFNADILPLVEKRYRVRTGRNDRALAGLSMGGAQTLNIGVPKLDQFGYLGVFSSGVFGIVPRPGAPPSQEISFEQRHRAVLDDPKLKEGLKLLWFATGKDDFLLETSRATVKMFEGHAFKVVYRETDGGHTWDKWREYLNEFAPQLFR